MGLFWDLIQQSQIGDHARRATTLEARVAELERDLDATRALLKAVIQRLEDKLGSDLDADGRVG